MKFILAILPFVLNLSFLNASEFVETKFDQAKQKNEKILLHFYASWCPTCKTQKEVLDKLQKDGFLKDITLFTVNFDTQTDFMKKLNVTDQSTFVSFFGEFETGRQNGIIKEKDIKNYLETTLISKTFKDQLNKIKENLNQRIPANLK